MSSECDGIERIAIERRGEWWGIREAYTPDVAAGAVARNAKQARAWVEAVHDDGQCECETTTAR